MCVSHCNVTRIHPSLGLQSRIATQMAQHKSVYLKLYGGAGEMAQWVKVFPAKPDDLSSFPENRMVVEENKVL